MDREREVRAIQRKDMGVGAARGRFGRFGFVYPETVVCVCVYESMRRSIGVVMMRCTV